jgi:hypothetical protein
MGLLKQLMIFGKTGLQGLPTRVTLPFRAIHCGCPKGLLGPPTQNMGPCGRLGDSRRTPIPENISGRSRSRHNTQCFLSAVGRPPGQRGILGQGLLVEGPGKPPFWRTLREFCKGLGPVTLNIKTQHTLRDIIVSWLSKGYRQVGSPYSQYGAL